MKNTMRKLFSLALVVVMLACAIPFSAFALTELELARQEQTKATEAYNNALANYNTVASDREALRTAKNNADTALANAKTARDLAAAKLTEATKAEADAKAASDAKYLANQSDSGYDHSQSDEYKAWNAANLALNSAQADSAAKQSALDAAQTAASNAANNLAPYDEMFARADVALKNAKLLKDAADEAVRVAESNQTTTPTPTPTPVPATVKVTVLKNDAARTQVGVYTAAISDINVTKTYDIKNLIPGGYTFISRKNGSTDTVVTLKAGENPYTVIVAANSGTVTPPSTTAVPATVKVTVLKNDTARTQIGVYSVSISDINVTKTYDIKNLIPSGYTFISRKNGSTDTVVTLSAGMNQYTVIVSPNSSSVSGGSNTSGGIWLGNNNNVVNKDPWPVYLNIYLNGNVSTIAKKVDITKGIAADGYVDLEDVKTVVKSYFNAKDSDGIIYDGLYIFDGSFGGQYTTDVGRVDGYGNINEDRKLSTVNINVMIKNAVAKGTTAAADTSNPKTGDMAFLTVTALVASAGALALVYANKKRFLVK